MMDDIYHKRKYQNLFNLNPLPNTLCMCLDAAGTEQ